MRWSYKTVHYELKKDGILGGAFLDESAIELSLNQYGKAGWELISLLETRDGVIAVFKQPIEVERRAVPATASPGLAVRPTVDREVGPRRPPARPAERDDSVRPNDGVEEAMLLDEVEQVEDKGGKKGPEARNASADVGLIRIE